MSTATGCFIQEGDPVTVTANDYSYDGWLVAKFKKRSGHLRCVVEDANGRLFIHNFLQLARKSG